MKRKALKFGTCYVCRKVDGWGLTMLDAHNARVTICKACHGPGCPECGKLFSRNNPATEYIIFGPDGDPEESEVRCSRCSERPEVP